MDIKVLIDGVEYRATDKFSISQQLGAVSSSDIVVEADTSAAVPRPFTSAQILFDGVPQFFGIIDDVVSPDFNTGRETRLYKLSISSGESIFNNRLVSEAFENMTTSKIVASLFASYIQEEGITLGEISDIAQKYDNYNCSFTKLTDVLDELADDVGASYYVSPDKKFYFLTRGSFEQIDAPAHITKLNKEEGRGDLRTVQVVTGASEKTSAQPFSVVWGEGQTIITLGYSVSSMNGITINGATAGVGKIGVDEEDTSKTFLYEIGSNVVSLNINATIQPAQGDIVVGVFVGYYDIVVTNTNESLKDEISALNGTSGKIEQVLTDETIKTFVDADAKAAALLSQYGEREQTLSLSCSDLAATMISKMWLFARDDLGVVGQYVVTERNIESYGPDALFISVKLKNKGYFAKYGTVLTSTSKTSGADVKVYKNSAVSDSVSVSDAVRFDSAGFAFWPSSGGVFIDPAFQDCMFPGVM